LISTRRIKETDSFLFRELRLRALKDSPEAFMSSYESALSRSPASWREQVELSSMGSMRTTLLAFDAGRAVGIVAAYQIESSPSVAEILQVWVDPNYRGRGIALTLFQDVIAWATSNGYLKLIATIHKENAEVVEFYERLGFDLNERETAQAPERDLILLLDLV